MKLATMTQVSVDGVMQGNGARRMRTAGADSSAADGPGKGDNETRTFINQTYERADAFLFGRRTYEIFARGWGVMDRGSHPIADALNTKPEYLASTTIADPQWTNTTVLSGDLAAAIGEMKAEPAGELLVHGSGALIRWPLANDLVDEMTLIIIPVVVGQGIAAIPRCRPGHCA
jgi:dihydrofolate reductase